MTRTNSGNVRRVLLECTDTYFTKVNTGIQRVCRNVAAESKAVGSQLGVPCKPIIRFGSQYRALAWRPHITRVRPMWKRAWDRCWPDEEGWNRNLLLRGARRVGRRIRKLFYPRTIVRKLGEAWWSLQGEVVQAGDGDLMVLLDAWWNHKLWPLVRQARVRGARIGVVMYDLLPVTNPEFFKSNVKQPFQSALRKALQEGDFFVSISEDVRNHLYHYATTEFPDREWHPDAFTHFRLGTTLDLASQRGQVRPALAELMHGVHGVPPYLTVGTIEPRKNHRLLLDAFDQLWPKYPHVSLCIVGRLGWLCDDLVNRIRQHPQYQSRLFMFNDVSDSELAYCYEHARALLFPSHAEGFGLPVAEALQHGLHVMASDIPVHREVGGPYCMYFDKDSPGSLVTLLQQTEQLGRFPIERSPAEYPLLNWTQATDEFLRRCLTAAACDAASEAEAKAA